MLIRIRRSLLLVLVFLAVASIGFVGTVRAQQAQDTLKFEQIPVRDALRRLFKTVDFYYSIDPRVQGVVTVDLPHPTFETVLNFTLRQADATYKVEGGVYKIVPLTQTGPFVRWGSDPREFYSLPPNSGPGSITSDDRYLYVLIGGVVEKLDKGTMRIVSTTTVTSSPINSK